MSMMMAMMQQQSMTIAQQFMGQAMPQPVQPATMPMNYESLRPRPRVEEVIDSEHSEDAADSGTGELLEDCVGEANSPSPSEADRAELVHTIPAAVRFVRNPRKRSWQSGKPVPSAEQLVRLRNKDA